MKLYIYIDKFIYIYFIIYYLILIYNYINSCKFTYKYDKSI